jgi:hypothetical protein
VLRADAAHALSLSRAMEFSCSAFGALPRADGDTSGRARQPGIHRMTNQDDGDRAWIKLPNQALSVAWPYPTVGMGRAMIFVVVVLAGPARAAARFAAARNHQR